MQVENDVPEMTSDLLQAMHEVGPVSKSVFTKKPTSPVRMGDGLTSSQNAHIIRYNQNINVDSSTMKTAKRALPIIRQSPRMAQVEMEWESSKARPGSLSESEASRLFIMRRDEPDRPLSAFTRDFGLSDDVVQALFSQYKAPSKVEAKKVKGRARKVG